MDTGKVTGRSRTRTKSRLGHGQVTYKVTDTDNVEVRSRTSHIQGHGQVTVLYRKGRFYTARVGSKDLLKCAESAS